MAPEALNHDMRVLLLAPTARDAEASLRVLTPNGTICALCNDLPAVCRGVREGAGAVILPEEAVLEDETGMLAAAINAQPVWSDLPVIVLSQAGVESPAVRKAMLTLGNVSLIERPVRVSTLLSMVKTALRARQRQYQIRDHLERRRRGEWELREATAQRERQARVFDTTLNYIRDFAYTFNLEGRFLYVNRALLDLWGLTLDQAVGKNFHELGYPPELAARLQRQIREVIETRRELRDETPYASPSGVVGYYEYIFVPVLGADGTVEVVAGSTRDVTERRRTEQALREARDAAEAASRAKDQFLAVLSHELRTPLSPVVMTLAGLETDPGLPVRLREDLLMVRRNIDLEVKLIDDLLDLSRVTTGKLRLVLQETAVHGLLRHVIQNSTADLSGRGLVIDGKLEASNDCVQADPARLQQVFWNLVRNAVKFTPGAGIVTVRTWNPTAERLTVEVRDTGVGISPEALPRIFDAFEQGDARVTHQFGGLGLGLAIAKALVDMHGGSIRAASDGPGKGAVFTVELPVQIRSQAGHDAPRAGEARRNGDARHLRLLLVEDHADTARTLARLLRLAGYEVGVAGTVATALQMASAQPFDLVISDIGLPDATGFDLMRQIRGQYRLPGIALSGYGMEDDMRRGREAGFVEYVVKPVDVGQLQAAIQRATTVSEASDAQSGCAH